ncbi:uncharacterized protein sS8_1616 [Methylocaldum marinum]|uniref:Right handed beta helix domain-containing protein n=1 Tax=Methylocaldum marinum TaxID=1432792 RepID=A0A250KPU5_9GAMM|nr:hypothetical protein [Methylocaldum marinum]BBA33574.1 uncharacterized protein sS8_1616 [Methylocaldum marinum]
MFSPACRFSAVAALAFWSASLSAEVIHAAPDNYRQMISRLKPGDTVLLAPGVYRQGLWIDGQNGRPGKPITLEGVGGRTVFAARPGNDTIVIQDSSYITLRKLEIDGRGLMVNGVRASGRFAHHIVLEDLLIHNLGRHQQLVGISTKCPAWDWEIRRNTVIGAGTGLYLGNSDGHQPFWGGVIEHNLIANTIGYNLQIKHQKPRPRIPGIPLEPRATVIRHNVFSKAAGGSTGPDARPNVLVGHWPLRGPGESDVYLIYGNFFFENPNEALFQGEGRIALYSNLFYSSHGNEFPAVAIQPHNDIPRKVRVFFNTVLHPGTGIRVLPKEGAGESDQRIAGNAVFAKDPILGGIQADNLTAAYAAARDYLRSPFETIGRLSLFPKPGRLERDRLDQHRFSEFPDLDLDFNGRQRDGRFRGAYSGAGSNPGWRLAVELKPRVR